MAIHYGKNSTYYNNHELRLAMVKKETFLVIPLRNSFTLPAGFVHAYCHWNHIWPGATAVINLTAIHHRKKDGGCTFYHNTLYLANLTQCVRHKESKSFTTFVPVLRTLRSLVLKII